MADADCNYCPTLEARLAVVGGGLRALAAFVDHELAEPTMPWKELIPNIVIRVENLADQAQGGY